MDKNPSKSKGKCKIQPQTKPNLTKIKPNPPQIKPNPPRILANESQIHRNPAEAQPVIYRATFTMIPTRNSGVCRRRLSGIGCPASYSRMCWAHNSAAPLHSCSLVRTGAIWETGCHGSHCVGPASERASRWPSLRFVESGSGSCALPSRSGIGATATCLSL